MNKLERLFENKEFIYFLKEIMESYRDRSGLGQEQKFKRTPYDGLVELGMFTVEGIKSECFKIIEYNSNLSRNKRDAILSIVGKAAYLLQKEQKKRRLHLSNRLYKLFDSSFTDKVQILQI